MTSKVYKRILLAIDFFDGNDVVIERARDFASLYEGELFVLHVNQPPTPAFGFDTSIWNTQFYEIQSQVVDKKRQWLLSLGEDLGVSGEHLVMIDGRPAAEIHDFCDTRNIDLVVLGTHGRHGLGLLLGSTANSVLHGSKCDVLAVRIKQQG